MLTKLSKSIYQYTRSNAYYDIIELLSEIQIQLSLFEIILLDEGTKSFSVWNTIIRPVSLVINGRSPGFYDYFMQSYIMIWIINIILCIYLIIPLIGLLSLIKIKYVLVPRITYSWISYVGYIHLYIASYIIYGWLVYQIKKLYTGNIIDSVLEAFSLILIIINTIITIFICKIYIYRAYLPGFISYKFQHNKWMNLIFKLAFPIFQVFESSSIRNITFLIFLIVWGIIRQLNLILANPYYNYITIKIMSCMQGITFGIIISNGIAVLIQSKFDNPFNIYGLLVFLISSFSSSFFMGISDKKISELLCKTERLSEIDYASQYSLIEQFTNDYHKKEFNDQIIFKNDIISNALLFSHKTKCNKCHNAGLSHSIRNHLLETKIFEGLNHYKESFILNCLAIDFYLNREYHSHRPFFLLEKLKKKISSIEDKLIFKIYEIKVEETLYTAIKDNNLEYGKFAECEHFCETFLCFIKNVTKTYSAFWSEVNSPRPNFLNLIKFGIQIHEDHIKFKKKMLIYKKKFIDDFTKPLLLAALYYDILKNNQDKSFLMLHKYRKFMVNNNTTNLPDHITKNVFYSKDNINIRVSAEDDSLGNIISFSGSIAQITHLDAGKLIGTNISQILPNIFNGYHNDFIREYKETGVGNIINRSSYQFCKHQYGHLIPIEANVSIYPILENSLMFLGIMRIIDTTSEYILINQDGQIEGMTLKISRELNYEPNHKIHFCSLLHPKKSNFHKDLNMKTNSSANINMKILIETQFEQNNSSYLIDKMGALSSEAQYGLSISSRAPQDFIFLFHNFVDDYFRLYSTYGKRIFLKKISNQNNHKFNDEITKKIEYFEYIAYLEKSCYKFDLQLYKLKLNKCDNIQKSVNIKCHISKLQTNSIINEDKPNFKQNKREFNFNEPFTNKPQFVRSLFYDRYNRLNVLEKKKVEVSINSQIKNNASIISLPSIIQTSPMQANESSERQTIINKETIIFDDKLDINENINEGYSVKTVYFSSNDAKKKTQIHKKKRQDSRQFIKFRSIFLEINALLMIILFLLSISSMFYIYSTNNISIPKINRGLMISYYSNQRLESLIEMDRRARIIWLIKVNIMSDQRLASRGVKSYYRYIMGKVIENSQFLIGNSTLIEKNIQNIEVEFQNDFYSHPVRLYDVDRSGQILENYSEINSFIAGYQIYQTVNTIKKLSINQITPNNTDLVFILRNSLNDIYIEYERSTSILVDEIASLISDNIQTSLIILLIILNMLIICIILLLPGLSALFYKKRSFLMKIVNINIKDCQVHLDRIKRFLKGLQENYSDTEFMNIYDENISFNKKAKFETGKEQNNKKANSNANRIVKTFGIKLGLTKSFLVFLAIAIIYIIIFFIQKTIVEIYMKDINAITERILFSSRMVAQQSFTMAMIYEFIAENGTTIVQNNPIDYSIDQTLSIIGNFQAFLAKFRDQNGDLDPSLEFIMIGNVCTLIPPSYTNECIFTGGGPGQAGISSLNSYIYKALSTALLAFTSSNRTIQDAIETFSLAYLLDVEVIFYRTNILAYNYLYDQLLEEFNNTINSYKTFLLTWILISFFGLLVIKLKIWFPTNRGLINEIMSMKQIMKIIPKSIIMKR